MIRIESAILIKSAASPSEYPVDNMPEIALFGRSNVGKSSLINALLNRRRLAKTSSTPGKTRRLNFYEINGIFRLVDLPGYGYAKVPKDERSGWKAMVEKYVIGRSNLIGAMVLIDVRREPDQREGMLFRLIKEMRLRRLDVITKIDKISRNRLQNRFCKISNGLPDENEIIPFSAITKEGKDKLWKEIDLMLHADSA